MRVLVLVAKLEYHWKISNNIRPQKSAVKAAQLRWNSLSHRNLSKTSHSAFPETRCWPNDYPWFLWLPWQQPWLSHPLCPPSPIPYRLDMTIIQRNWILWDYISENRDCVTYSQLYTLPTQIPDWRWPSKQLKRMFLKPSRRLQTKCLFSVSQRKKKKNWRLRPKKKKEAEKGKRCLFPQLCLPDPAGWCERCSNTLLMQEWGLMANSYFWFPIVTLTFERVAFMVTF